MTTPPSDRRPLVADGTAWGSPEWYTARWEALSDLDRAAVVGKLRNEAAPGTLDEIRTLVDQHGLGKWIHAPGHHGFGTGIRNLLRDVLPDDQLPPAPYPDGAAHSNWDDYYVQALEAAAGAREL